MNNTKKINDNGNTPAALTQTKKERERAELAAYLAAALPRCSLDTLREVFTQVSNELPAIELPEREKEIKKIYRLLQLLSLKKLQNLYMLVLYM